MPVYFILEQNETDWRIKIGRARDLVGRRRALQTGNSRALKVVGWIRSDNEAAAETELHAKYARRNVRNGADSTSREWFYLQPADILDDLVRAGANGFVAKNADAFEVIGYDRDAVPEYLGVWDWASLELEECCPFCGCMCGMHFENASQMFNCMNCGALTDFSENHPDFDNEEDYAAWQEWRKRTRTSQ